MRNLFLVIKKSINSISSSDHAAHSNKSVFNRGEIALTLTLLSIGLMLLGSAAGVMQSKNVQQFFGRAAESCTYDYTISVYLDRQNGTLLGSSQNGGSAVTASDARSPAGPETLTSGTVSRSLTSIAPYIEGDTATITLGGLSNMLEVKSTFCEDKGTKITCPANKNQRSKVFSGFTPKCGAKINYGWVVGEIALGSTPGETITIPVGRPTEPQATARPTSPFRPQNSPTPSATAGPVCSFAAKLELQDENGVVLTNVSGARVTTETDVASENRTNAPFPSIGPARITTSGIPKSLENKWANVTLSLPQGYELAQGTRSMFCNFNRGAIGTCSKALAINGGLTISGVGLICGGDVTYGWKLRKVATPTSSIQSGSGSINVRTYVVLSDEKPSGNLCDANFLKTNLNKAVRDSRNVVVADIRSYEGECGIGARLLGASTYANKMERNPGDTHIPADRRVGCGFFGLHQLPVGNYNVEFLDKTLLPSADPGKPNELDVVCSNAASNINVSNGGASEAAIVLWPKPSKACETTSGSSCSAKSGFSQTARMSKNERTGVGYEVLCCKDRTKQPQSGGPGCYCTNKAQCGTGTPFYTPSYCSVAGDGLCCVGGAQPKPEQLVPPTTTGTVPSGTPAQSCSGVVGLKGAEYTLSCASRNDCNTSSSVVLDGVGNCRLNTVCCAARTKEAPEPQACNGKVQIKGTEFGLRCASRSDCNTAGGVGMSGVGDCKINNVCCAVKSGSDEPPASCQGSTSSHTFSCANNKNCTSAGGTVVDLPGCTNSLQACCAMPKKKFPAVTSSVVPLCQNTEIVNGTNSKLDCALDANVCRSRNGGTGVVMGDKRNCTNVCCAEPNIAVGSANSAVVRGDVSVQNLAKLIDDSDRDAYMLYSCKYSKVTSGVFGGVTEDKKTHATIEFNESEDLNFRMSTIVKDDTNWVRCSGGVSYNDRRGKLTITDDGKINKSIGRDSDISTSIRLKYESFNIGDSGSLSLGFDTTSVAASDRQAKKGGSIISFETIGADPGALELSVGMCKGSSSQCYSGGFLNFEGGTKDKVYLNVPEGLTRSTLSNPSCTLRLSGSEYPCTDFSILDNEVNYLVKSGDSVAVTKQSGLADVNGDGEVNSIDFLTLTGSYELGTYDLNLDGQTNALDVDASRTWLGTSLTN